ncbi:LIC_10190 family membrane protein [Lusitaniella coriacea]|uniref:LIC_10190 family membrane protein n=1 Tax=Lusitaniella coriacea TaxID=1983105 RepID=UPI003CF714BB
MIFSILIWTFLMFACCFIGTAVLNLLRADCFERTGDRALLAIWLGVVLVAISLLAASLWVPLSPGVGLLVIFILCAIPAGICRPQHALLLKGTIPEFKKLSQSLSWQWVGIFFCCAFGTAAFTTQLVTAYDTGLYHFQVIQWLSQFGTVPGLALLFYTFGYPSSWLAFAAPLNFGILEARTSAIPGGLILLLLTLQLVLSCYRIFQNRQQFADWFIAIAGCICLPVIIWLRLPISPSPDVPVVGLGIVIAWSIIIIANHRDATSPNKLFDASLIPIILGAGALTMKLSALVLLFIAFVFYIFKRSFSLKRFCVGSGLSLLLISPMLVFGMITSGCPLYPASIGCFEFLPWSIGAETAKEATQRIQECARWTCPPLAPENANNWNWLGHWVNNQKQATFLIIASLISTIAILRSKPSIKIEGYFYILVLGLLGILFMMYGSPAIRLGIGYLYLIPTLILAVYCHENSRFKAFSVIVVSGATNLWLGISPTGFLALAATLSMFAFVWINGRKISNVLFLSLLLILSFSITLRPELVAAGNSLNWVLPPAIKNLNQAEFYSRQVNDIKYISPKTGEHLDAHLKEDRCWAKALPCTPYLTHEDIQLRVLEKGIEGGFIRKRTSD